MKLLFTIEVTVSAPILVGQDTVNGRRQLIPINGGKLYGVDIFDQPMEGTVLQGEFIDPSLYYFATTPKFEVYDDSLRWLENKVLVCKAVRKPDTVQIMYYLVE